jgi:hypothetical protein
VKTLKHFLLVLFSLILMTAGCSKKEEPAGSGSTAGQQGGGAKKESVVKVPDSVKGKWRAVKIAVLDKESQKETVLTIPIGQTVQISGSSISLAVDTFLPHFMIDGTALTSLSNDPKNPAALVRVLENGKELHKGWLYSLYPTTHAYQHPKYGFTLVDFIPAS